MANFWRIGNELVKYGDQIVVDTTPPDVSGGTITIVGDYKVHTFTEDGSLIVSTGGRVSALVVGGGGGSGWARSTGGPFRISCPAASGGGGGGWVENKKINISAITYNIIIGNGGSGGYAVDASAALPGKYTRIVGLIDASGGQGGERAFGFQHDPQWFWDAGDGGDCGDASTNGYLGGIVPGEGSESGQKSGGGGGSAGDGGLGDPNSGGLSTFIPYPIDASFGRGGTGRDFVGAGQTSGGSVGPANTGTGGGGCCCTSNQNGQTRNQNGAPGGSGIVIIWYKI